MGSRVHFVYMRCDAGCPSARTQQGLSLREVSATVFLFTQDSRSSYDLLPYSLLAIALNRSRFLQCEDDGMVRVGVDEHVAQFVFDLFGFGDAAHFAVEIGQLQLVTQPPSAA